MPALLTLYGDFVYRLYNVCIHSLLVNFCPTRFKTRFLWFFSIFVNMFGVGCFCYWRFFSLLVDLWLSRWGFVPFLGVDFSSCLLVMQIENILGRKIGFSLINVNFLDVFPYSNIVRHCGFWNAYIEMQQMVRVFHVSMPTVRDATDDITRVYFNWKGGPICVCVCKFNEYTSYLCT